MISSLLIGIVTVIHVYIVILEMLLWDKPAGLRTFKLTPEFAAQSKTLAANQGLYNGFLVAGLLWGLLQASSDFKVFFLICVIVAGLYGAATVGRKILFVQALPAVLALAALLAGL